MLDQVRVLDGATFMISEASGDVRGGSDGLFHRDVRHLSCWEIRVDGSVLPAMVGQAIYSDTAVFYQLEHDGSVHDLVMLSLIRDRQLGAGMRERLTLNNWSREDRPLVITIRFAADFADIFEVKDGHPGSRETAIAIGRSDVSLSYVRGDYRRATVVHAPGAYLTEGSATYEITVPAGGEWSTEVAVTMTGQDDTRPGDRLPRPGPTDWLEAAPHLDTDWPELGRTYRQSLADLAALRLDPDVTPHASLLAGGLPWYMTVFGRDAIIASYQALPFVPELARTTLRALAARQAVEFDDVRDAEPGKIMHELRHGELAYFGDQPQSPYYGTCDATPLFLILLDEYERWTADVDTVAELEDSARAALRWVEEFGDLDGDGYLEYQTRNPVHGLGNQCWKDSDPSICHPDGRLADLPRATCEIQGYAYDARVRTARLATAVWHDAALAGRLMADAAALRERFNHDFWLPRHGWYALALDGRKKAVPTLTSNIGHLLWSGIVPDDRAALVAEHLLDRRTLFSGWGVRTLAAGQPAFNPTQYHNGTIWPHDNALIAAGLTRYGLREHAATVTRSLLEAAPFFDHRLPEAFLGVDRGTVKVPVPYPHAGCPQAWASGAPLLLIRALLGLEPGADGPVIDPHLPDSVRRLVLRGVPGRWGKADVGVT